MAGFKERLTEARQRHPWLDRVIGAAEHYSQTQGSQRAGAVTYFGFLSFFPILALAFFVVGKISTIYPEANEDLIKAINEVLPIFAVGQDGNGSGLSMSTFSDHANTLGLVGLVGVLYSGLGWLSSLREALVAVFGVEAGEKPSFVAGKVRDLLSLVVLGLILILSVAVAGFVSGFSADVLGWFGLGSELAWLVTLASALFGLGANVVLFFAIFKVLARPELTTRELLGGAVLGAVGFELLKQFAFVLLGSTERQPAFQVFGISLILLVWIYYFSQLALFSAAWAATAPTAVARQVREERDEAAAAGVVHGPAYPTGMRIKREQRDQERWEPGAVFAAGAAAMLAVVRLVRRRK